LDTIETIKNRRSIRKYTADPVDEAILETILDSARLAPSWSNTQCWRFIIVRSDNLKAQLSEALAVNPELGNNPSTNAIKTAPVVIVACAEKGIAGYYNGQPATNKGDSWYMFDIGLAMENLVLAAAALGLGTVHVGLFDSQKVAAILEIPETFHVVEMTPLGYPEYQPKPRPRKELGEIIFREKFGQK
jgi:nitroreductase